ncbi:transcriptional regulator [[Haemophilus] ducreyi]|uniref:HTH-type transcriptional regulator UlaR n=1 Tax=Haemophilus ducreyi TaxID=730 RepID=UPI0007CDE5FE|nr:HTH-type transcriptional regulator UlaR [[Haemophilus] ducreyi]ANF70049.1 transcriptional regulator [[Haemophilus] ducreyi]ANF72767.1 transcriptional regulator [[Haemophilus] ducreyi]
MNENFRHKKLLSILEAKQMLSTLEIMELLNVSPATARRDINKLSEQNKLRKVRNGVEAIHSCIVQVSEPTTITQLAEKTRIAKMASNLCRDDDSIIMTCGTTMQLLGQQLCGRNVQIITNSLPLANYLIEQHDDVVIMGGQYNKEKKVTLSLNQQKEFVYAASIMFTSGRSFTTDGLFKTDMIIANSEAQMSYKANKYVVLLDSSKLDAEVGMLFRDIRKIDLLITGKEADATVIKKLREQGLEIMLA